MQLQTVRRNWMIFIFTLYGCESWTIKKAERQRIDAFKLWCWRRPLRLPWTARRSNQSILKEITPEYSLEGLMLKLKLQYLGHLMQSANSLEKTLMLGKIEGRRRRVSSGQDSWMASLTQGMWVWACSRRWWRIGKLGILQFTGSQRVRHHWVTEQQQHVSVAQNFIRVLMKSFFVLPPIYDFLSSPVFNSFFFFLSPHYKLWICSPPHPHLGIPGGSVVKNPMANAGDVEMRAQSLGQKGPLEKEMTTHSCLKNSMDRGDWWVTVHGIAKESDTT